MNTPCPHCRAEIEIDPEIFATLQGHANFQCPSCDCEVPVPPSVRPRVKLTLDDLKISNQPSSHGNHPSSAALPKRGMDRKLLMLGAAALVFAAGLIFYMKSRPSPEAALPTVATVAKITFPSRTELDAKLVFEGKTSAFLKVEDKYAFESFVPEIENRNSFPVYKDLWGEKQVFVIHPIAKDKPGVLDFSKITKHAKGILTVKARNHPKGNCRIEMVRGDGTIVHTTDVKNKEWITMQVPFNDETITLQVHATGWYCEHAFITYSIQ